MFRKDWRCDVVGAEIEPSAALNQGAEAIQVSICIDPEAQQIIPSETENVIRRLEGFAMFFLEVRSNGIAEMMAHFVSEQVRRSAYGYEAFVVSASNLDDLALVSKTNSQIRLGLRFDGRYMPRDVSRYVRMLKPYSVHLSSAFAQKETIAMIADYIECGQTPPKVLVYDVNDVSQLERAIDAGADGVFTSKPQEMRLSWSNLIAERRRARAFA